MSRAPSVLHFLGFTLVICLYSLTEPRVVLAQPVVGPGQEILNFDVVRDLIVHNNVRSVDGLIPLLPESYRKNFVLMYDSKSSQGASPEAPRVILFGETAQSILSFNGDPAQRGYQTIEMIDFDPRAQTFDFRQIDFSGGRPSFSVKNPTACVGCHRGREKELRPNWGVYPDWPGAYGSQDDVPRADELGNLRKFLAGRFFSERYRHLEIPPLSLTGQFSSQPKGHFRYRPNARFTMLLARLNAKKILGLFKREKNFSAYRDLLLAASANYGIVRSELLRNPDIPKLFTPANLIRIRDPQSDILEIVSEEMGLTPADWSLEFGVKTYGQKGPFARSEFNFTYFDGIDHLPHLFYNELWQDLASEDEYVRERYVQKKLNTGPTYRAAMKDYPEAKVFDDLGGTGGFGFSAAKEIEVHSLERLRRVSVNPMKPLSHEPSSCQDIFKERELGF